MQERKPKVIKRKKSFIRMAALALPLFLLLLSQTVFARNTYVITDGDTVLVHTSAATDPAAVLNEAGLALGEDDTYTTQTGIGVSEITVNRSQTVTVENCGQVLTVSDVSGTVGELLQQLDIAVGGNVAVSVPLEMELADDLVITISETVRTTETYTTSIPYETVYCTDDSIPEGTQVVMTTGVDGQLLCNANVVYVDGQETSRTVMEQTVVSHPVNEVIAVGTGGATVSEYLMQLPVISDGTITLPTGEVLTYTGTFQAKASAYTHTDAGCDFITATGTTVRIGTVAVDPTVIPYGTRMFIVSNDGMYIYGIATAEDCGSAIKENRIDLYFPTHDECIQFGRRDCTIYFLG